MKKILIIALVVVVVAGLVAAMYFKSASGYTKVLTGKIVRQDLATVVSGTGQIKAKYYVNLGATAMGRITHLNVKEGERVTKGEIVATIEHVQQEASVDGQAAAIEAAKTDIAADVAAEKTQEANVDHAKADLEQKKLDWDRAQALYKEGIMAKQDYDAKKAAYDLDVASVSQAVAQLNQAKAQTDSGRGHMQTQVAMLRGDKNLLDLTEAIAPFDGIVTNEPLREGETVVEGIQNTEGSTIMTIADMSVVTAEVKVDETDIVNIQIGQNVRCHGRRHSRKGFQGTRNPRRRSGIAALHRRGHLAVHYRHRRGQGFQGRRHPRQSHERTASWTFDNRQDHNRAEVERGFAAYPGPDHAHARG